MSIENMSTVSVPFDRKGVDGVCRLCVGSVAMRARMTCSIVLGIKRDALPPSGDRDEPQSLLHFSCGVCPKNDDPR